MQGTPFGVDSLFEENIRLYFYSTVSDVKSFSLDTLKHVWFQGLDTIQVEICMVVDSKQSGVASCHTEISPKLLKPGEWSVDLVAGRKLLSSRQFRIEADR